MIERFLIIVCIHFLILASSTLLADNNTEHEAALEEIKRFQTSGDFNDVKEFLLQAIAGRGIKISSTSYISKMLQRTKEAVGGREDIFKNAEAIGFCSATLSRQMMESDPHHIVFCPYTIVIYELAKQPGIIYLAFRRPVYSNPAANDKSLEDIDKLMSDIITEVIE